MDTNYEFEIRVYALNFKKGNIAVMVLGVRRDSKEEFWDLMRLVFNSIDSVYKVQLFDIVAQTLIDELK